MEDAILRLPAGGVIEDGVEGESIGKCVHRMRMDSPIRSYLQVWAIAPHGPFFVFSCVGVDTVVQRREWCDVTSCEKANVVH